jgi:O-antigen/teichoic acid export membrane protein
VITTTASLAAVAAAAAATGEGRRLWPNLVPVGAMRAADALADLYYGLWQRDERMRPIGVGLALNAAASVAFMLALAAAGGGAPGAAAGSALGSWVALAYVHLRTSADPELRAALAVRPPAGPGRLLRLAREAAPLGLIVLLGSLQANVPRYFLQRQAGAAALGLFAAASQLTSAGSIVIGALGAAATPRVARLFAAGDGPGLRAVTRGLVLAGAGLGVLGVLLSAAVGRPVLAVVFRPEFAAAAPTLVVLSAAAGLGFVATLLGYLLTAARSIAVQPVLLLATLAATSAGCALLVPARGAPGAAWALAAGAAVQLGWSAIAVARLRPGARADAAAPDLPLGRAESP